MIPGPLQPHYNNGCSPPTKKKSRQRVAKHLQPGGSKEGEGRRGSCPLTPPPSPAGPTQPSSGSSTRSSPLSTLSAPATSGSSSRSCWHCWRCSCWASSSTACPATWSRSFWAPEPGPEPGAPGREGGGWAPCPDHWGLQPDPLRAGNAELGLSLSSPACWLFVLSIKEVKAELAGVWGHGALFGHQDRVPPIGRILTHFSPLGGFT